MRLVLIASLLFSLAACAGKSRQEQRSEPISAPQVADPNADIGVEAKQTTKVETEVPIPVQTVGEAAEEVLLPTTTVKQVKQAGVPAEKALGWLKNGNTRYVKRLFRADGQSPADRTRLVSNQNPHSTIFACSDSRIPPEIIFDQKLGEIYVVRTEALLVDNAVIASLEKGLSLGTQLFVVLSHEGCADLEKVANELLARSAPLAEAITDGRANLQTATYNLKTGLVEFQK